MADNVKPKRAIEESFPIVEINRLAVPERKAYMPIYQMHKWFARRASCVFRAILLAAMKPIGTNIMADFYKDHSSDPETNGVRILDPFMGGGTTIIEALRLGCHITGIDLNPVAWFVVKSEATMVSIEDLKTAYKRLEMRMTDSGKTVKDELLSLYKTECPCCGAGRSEADIIYTFWVKSAICTNPTCKNEIPLFADYILSSSTPTIRYVPDYKCNHCKRVFDLELTRSSLIAEQSLMVSTAKDSCGNTRTHKRWAVLNNIHNNVTCPWCSRNNALPPDFKPANKSKKMVNLLVLLCPYCSSIWQWRGTLVDDLQCPVCKKSYNPNVGNVLSGGSFICPSCGTKDKTIGSIRKLPKNKTLSFRPYAIQGYCASCAGESSQDIDLLGNKRIDSPRITHLCNLFDNNGKFFKKISSSDLKLLQDIDKRWTQYQSILPYPKSEIPDGQETHRLLEHHYKYWHQMFNSRQLYGLSTLLKTIGEENDQTLKEMLLSAFFNLLNNMSDFCTYIWQRDCIRQIFARHDFAPKSTICESSVWGTSCGMGSYSSLFEAVINGKTYNITPYDRKFIGDKTTFVASNEHIKLDKNSNLICNSSQSAKYSDIDYIITDPPYGGNVNYSELADYFYVWLRLALSSTYPCFSPEITPKIDEIVENPARGKSAIDYKAGLCEVWNSCFNSLKSNGLMIFTFHHAEGDTWEALLESICNSGFVIEAIYPIHGEAESSLHLQDKQAISYDLIHVCKKRLSGNSADQKSWAGVRDEIRKKAREEIKLIEAGRYGQERLSTADTNIILIGKCLELYSKHYGKIVDYKGEPVPLKDALISIRIMAEQLTSAQHPLPSELEQADPISYIYLTCLCDRKEIQSDEVHKATRGLFEPEALMKAGLMRKGRAKRGRTYEIIPPGERIDELKRSFQKIAKEAGQQYLFPEMEEARFDRIALVDVLHFMMGMVEAGDNLQPWLRHFEIVRPQIRVALEYLRGKNPTFQNPINKILGLIEG